eukprot:CAMPEP_0114559514 /NCGR_PEP_ID=MMETSP0114-20121206/10959_1 /TAXON_ID=31324 /ORGANISM="Goniomonas sp, Strain m" /LENGTH=133 /DNA_ID=CAMNT_0001744983 /DNA_START=14 /DNA_END=415 /DNA_ORIENTATION=+
MAVNPDEVGKAFIQHYYQMFDTNPPALAALYQEPSSFSIEGKRVQGPAAIVQALQEFLFQDGKPKFQSLKHNPTIMDIQPALNNGIVIFVSGTMVIDGNEGAPLMFSQCFQLMPLPQGGGYYCLNDIFRLNLA